MNVEPRRVVALPMDLPGVKRGTIGTVVAATSEDANQPMYRVEWDQDQFPTFPSWVYAHEIEEV